MKILTRRHTIKTFDDSRDCAIELHPGERLRVETVMGSRAASGPINVVGAEPGDAVAVRIVDVGLEPAGKMWARPGAGLLGEELFDHIDETFYHDIVMVDSERAQFWPGIEVALSPNVGVVGVAPGHEGPESDTRWPGRHGGNLDCNLVRRGATVYLPVYRPGARLCIGDIHARMGDGEIVTCGLEIAGVVDIEVRVLSAVALTGPIVDDGSGIGFLASAKTFDLASKLAVQRAVKAIATQTGLDFVRAALLASLIVDLRVAQIVNPRVTAVAYISNDDLQLDSAAGIGV